MTTKELLVAARKKIEKPENWTQRKMARDFYGNETFHSYPNAISWCALGSLLSVCGLTDTKIKPMNSAVNLLEFCIGDSGIIHFNDSKTHEEVLDMFSCAIQKAEADENIHSHEG